MKKTAPIDLSNNSNKDSIQNRLVEVALYDWINRSLGMTETNIEQISHFLQAYGVSIDYSLDIAVVLTSVDSFKPNKLEYALLYNQIGEVPQKDARDILKVGYVNPLSDVFKNYKINESILFPELRLEIKKTLIKVNRLSFDYKSLKDIEIK